MLPREQFSSSWLGTRSLILSPTHRHLILFEMLQNILSASSQCRSSVGPILSHTSLGVWGPQRLSTAVRWTRFSTVVCILAFVSNCSVYWIRLGFIASWYVTRFWRYWCMQIKNKLIQLCYPSREIWEESFFL